MTPQQLAARERRLVSAAKAPLAMHVGVTVGALRMTSALRSLPPSYTQAHPAFGQFVDSIPKYIPLGGARLLWSYGLLLETDEQLARIEATHRRTLMLECIRIIEAYSERAPGDLMPT